MTLIIIKIPEIGIYEKYVKKNIILYPIEAKLDAISNSES